MKRTGTENATMENPYGGAVVQARDGVSIAFEDLTPAPSGGRLLARGAVRITAGPLTFVSSFWRIVANEGSTPRIYPPSIRLGTAWIETIQLPQDAVSRIESVLLDAWRRKDRAES